MAIQKEKLISLIEASFPGAEIHVESLVDDGDHYSVVVKSILFQGLSRIEQHKLVYESLQGAMGDDLHALAIKTEQEYA